jgi:hypothetical protein
MTEYVFYVPRIGRSLVNYYTVHIYMSTTLMIEGLYDLIDPSDRFHLKASIHASPYHHFSR